MSMLGLQLSLHGINAMLLQHYLENLVLGEHDCSPLCHSRDMGDQVGRDEPRNANAPISYAVEYHCRSGKSKLVCK